MKDPLPEEYVRCPDARSERTHKPKQVFDNGSYGILGAHGHGFATRDCPHKDLPTVIRPKYEKVIEPKPMAGWSEADRLYGVQFNWRGAGI